LRYKGDIKQKLETLKELFREISSIVDVIVVEGYRDIQALKNLGYEGKIISCQQVGVSDYEFLEKLVQNFKKVLILSDFDQKGLRINKQFSTILEQSGIKIEHGFRREIGRFTAGLGVYAIEDLENLNKRINNMSTR
jgi:5S rRNA maturation endonuclease (ribonuclease M5)